MRRLFSVLNAFNLLFLVTAATFGYLRHPRHMLIGLLADLSAVFALCLSLALFVGAAKLVKEHVGRYDLDLELIERLNRIFHPFFVTVLICVGLLVVVGVFGGTLLMYPQLARIHGAFAVLAIGAYTVGAFRIRDFQRDLSALVAEVDDQAPETETPGVPADGDAKDGFVPDVVDWRRNSTRARAWIAGGAALVVVTLHIELAVEALRWFWGPVGVVSAALIGVGVVVSRRRDTRS